MDRFIIRPYKIEDEDKVINLWRKCGLVVPHNDPKEDIDTKIAFQPELFFIGLIDDKIITSVMSGYEGHRGWINYLAVLPEFQRKGFASLMMEKAEEVLREMGCLKINLQVREGNETVIAFYESIGYTDDHVISFGKRLK
ncbi:MAG: GNAT family acetyltransferase [bacterium]